MIPYQLLEVAAKGTNPVTMIVILVVMFGLVYFMMIRPQKKQQQKEQEMRDKIFVGDDITTIGGIMGRVVTLKDDSLIIETGADRNRMRIARWAIQANNTALDKAEDEREAAKLVAEKEKEDKKEAKRKDKEDR